MLTIEKLSAFGAVTEEGIARCAGNRDFYLRLVGMALADKNFDRLKNALESGNAAEGFEAAHALKGSLGNLSLKPLYDPICELTEKLRGKTSAVDTGDLLTQVLDKLEEIRGLQA